MSEIFGAVKLKYKITIASSMAILAVLLAGVIGVLTFVTVDRHTHEYRYSLERMADGSFNLIGVCSVDNCESPFYSETGITDVKILTAKSPTCSKEGNVVYTYTKDGVTIKYTEKIPMTAHAYDFVIDEEGDVVNLNGTCTEEDCQEKISINNVQEFKLVSSVCGTCFTPRQDTYSYVLDGEEHTFVTLVDENIPHTLNGVSADLFKNNDGKYVIGTPGVKLVKNEALACGATAEGYYVCEVCKQVEKVQVVRAGHKFLYSESNVTEPTIDKDGFATLVCHNTECTETVKVTLPAIEVDKTATLITGASEAHPMTVKYSFESTEHGFKFEKEYQIGEKLSHNYTYELELNEHTGKFDVFGKCDQVGCTAPEVCIDDDVPAVFVKDTSTCQVPGIVIWSYDYNGETLYFQPISNVVSDHSYTYDNFSAIRPDLDKTGLIVLYCTTEGCDHEVVVELPKAVIGENAKFAYEDPENHERVYKYTYKTEYNCTVELLIILNDKDN